MGVDVNTLKYQDPGGMLSNLVSQLKQSNALDKFQMVLKEIPKVRKDFGYPPLVTPTSQIVGTQAVMNVLTGERYKMVPKESKALVKGEYGKTPAPIPAEITKKILGDEKPITGRPADLIKPELESIRAKIKDYIEQDEDILSYALFPAVAEKFFKHRKSVAEGTSDDDEIIAAITAAITAIGEEEGKDLVVTSFSKVPQTSKNWALAGKLQRFFTKL